MCLFTGGQWVCLVSSTSGGCVCLIPGPFQGGYLWSQVPSRGRVGMSRAGGYMGMWVCLRVGWVCLRVGWVCLRVGVYCTCAGSSMCTSCTWDLGYPPPGGHHNMYGWQAGGMHPTRMLSCWQHAFSDIFM